MRKAFITLAVLTLTASAVLLFATAQIGDILVLNGKKYSIQTNPLRTWLESNPDRLPKPAVTSSANWRGYVATWEVKSDRLLLVDIEMQFPAGNSKNKSSEFEYHSVLSKVFPEKKEVFADWFTGHIIVPDGDLVRYTHMGYASTYEKYLVLRVEHGIVTKSANMPLKEFSQFRERQFAAYKKTEDYKKALAEISKEGTLNSAQNEEFLREFASEEYLSRIFGELD